MNQWVNWQYTGKRSNYRQYAYVIYTLLSIQPHAVISLFKNFYPTSVTGTKECHIIWWRHEMETFSALMVLCAGNSPVTGEFHAQRPVTRSFDVFFDLRLNKRLSKQSWG